MTRFPSQISFKVRNPHFIVSVRVHPPLAAIGKRIINSIWTLDNLLKKAARDLGVSYE